MLIGLLARRWCKSPKAFVYDKFTEKKAWSRKGSRTAHFAWLYTPIILYAQLKVYKLPLKIKLQALFIRLGLPVSFLLPFLSFSSLFFLQDDWFGVWGLSETTYLPGLLRPTREGAQGGAPSAIRESACGLRGQSKFGVTNFISFPCKPVRSSLWSLCCDILFANAVLLRESLDPTGAGPQQGSIPG